MDDKDAWFAPKRYGYGAGLPIGWQGWAVVGLYVPVVTFASLFVRQSVVAWGAVLLFATAALIVVSATHTRGGWRWRWGEDDGSGRQTEEGR